jgi:hypothetical protein
MNTSRFTTRSKGQRTACDVARRFKTGRMHRQHDALTARRRERSHAVRVVLAIEPWAQTVWINTHDGEEPLQQERRVACHSHIA